MVPFLQDCICIESPTFGVTEMMDVFCLPPNHQEGFIMVGNL
jgi:hypothetical protein